jgi:alanyl-tRNA synthetase
VSEGSIGSNLRRLEAVTGFGPIDRLRQEEALVARAANALGTTPEDLPASAERLRSDLKAAQVEIKELRRKAAGNLAVELAATATDGVVVARIDGTSRDEVRELALAVRQQPGVRAVVIGGEPDSGGVALVAAATKDSGLDAKALIADAGRQEPRARGRGRA